MIVSGAVLPIIVLANSGSFETKTQCMSILQRMLLGRAMPEEASPPSNSQQVHQPIVILFFLPFTYITAYNLRGHKALPFEFQI